MNKLRAFLSRQETNQLVDVRKNEDYHGHIYLGNMYMALSRFDLAEAEYQRADAVRSTPETTAKLANVRGQRNASNPSATSGMQSHIRRAA